ncbi:MAG: ABC transporter permease [Acidobacteriota bacterium]
MRIWRWLVRLYPEEFRLEYGRDLLDDLQGRSREERRAKFYVEAAGDVVATAWKEHCRIMFRDFVHSFRRMLSQPGMALIAVLSLALGIGANTTMFSIIYASMWRPLPYPDADRRVVVFQVPTNAAYNFSIGGATSSDFMDWRTQSKMLDQWHLFTRGNPTTSVASGVAERIFSQSVTPGTMEALGIRPLLGRLPQPGEEDDRPTVISEEYWKRSFGADPTVLGRRFGSNNESNMIVGVLPAGVELFNDPGRVDAWPVVNLSPGSEWVQRRIPWLLASARLKLGVRIEQAQEEMSAIAARLERAHPATNKNRGVKLASFRDARNGQMGHLLYPLFGAVGFVLLIACANVTNLLLARASARRREISVRAAIGATRGRLIREFLMDGAVLAVPGVFMGVLVAYAGLQLFRTIVPQGFPGATIIELNVPVLIFTAAVGASASIAAAFFPALQGARVELTDALKESGRGSGSRMRQLLRSSLVAGEIALALILLAGTGLLINTTIRLAGMERGFDAKNVTVVEIDLAGTRYMTNAPTREIDMRYVEPAVGQFIEHALRSARALPGVEHAAFAGGVPLGPSRGPNVGVRIAMGQANADELRNAAFNSITSGYFETLRIPVKLGRAITERDTYSSPWVAVVNEAFVREFFPNGTALGQVVTLNLGPEDRQREIVGVVGDAKQQNSRYPARPEVFASHFQQPREIPGNFQGQRFRSSLIFRTNGTAPPSRETLSRIVTSFDKNLPIVELNTLDSLIAMRDPGLKLVMSLLGVFSGIALLLAVIGIYGLMSHAVADRVHEIGIRSSLGASRSQILWLIGSYGCKLAAAGITVGTVGALVASRALQVMLFGVKPGDPLTLALTALLLLMVSAAACALPAMRAAQIDPATALRRE